MDKKKLKQYTALKKELKIIDEKLDKLYDRNLDVPTIIGKVTGSSHDFPYTEVRTSVYMDEPKEADAIRRLIDIKRKRRVEVNSLIIEIESFISAIPDSEVRQIFELTYIDGLKMREVGEAVGYSKGRISQIISKYLKD